MNQVAALQTRTVKSPPSRRHSQLVQRKCGCGGASGVTGSCSECSKKRFLGQPFQARLRINEPGDAYEQEADQVAARVMQKTEHDWGLGLRQSGGLVQRRIAGHELSGHLRATVQRQAAESEPTPAEGSPQSSDTPSQKEEKESSCPSWRGDPESISKRAAETYVRNDMTPPSQATVERIDCEPPVPNGNYGCYVHFSDGLVIRVIVRAKDIVVGTGPGPFTTLTPPPATPLCFYDYTCPEGQLILTKRECKSAKPAGSSGPTLVGQRRAAAGAAGMLDAAPFVDAVLASPGEPLDAAAEAFFSARFGHDFSNVRVHANAAAAESAEAVNALAFTVGNHVVLGAGQYSPRTRAGQELLAHELTHVVQQGAAAPGGAEKRDQGFSGTPAISSSRPASGIQRQFLQRQPKSDGPEFRDVPILLEKLQLDVAQNLLDNGHHLYRAATLFPDNPEGLKTAFGRYALGANVLKDTYRFFGVAPDTAGKLAVGTGILFKGLTFLREGELTLDFQFDVGRGVKFETNLKLAVDPKNVTDVRKADVNFGFVRRF